MSHAIFLHSVHGQLPHPPRGSVIVNANGLIIPKAIRGAPFVAVLLNEQVEAAVRDPSAFVQAMNLLRPQQKPVRAKVLCPNVYALGRCLDGHFCQFSGNLAELYAHNIFENQFYKTKKCRFEHCKKGAACSFGHVGDLMRRVHVVKNRVFTDGWYILRTPAKSCGANSNTNDGNDITIGKGGEIP